MNIFFQELENETFPRKPSKSTTTVTKSDQVPQSHKSYTDTKKNCLFKANVSVASLFPVAGVPKPQTQRPKVNLIAYFFSLR